VLVVVSHQIRQRSSSASRGKSSLVDLLVGLLVGLITPSRGRILVDGVDLARIDLNSWQRSLGVVSKELLLLLNGSIRDNIAFSVPEA
jgi:ABC-type multidrug transport system fused ATPase/permease subunit